MIQLINPLALLALFTFAIPITIHLLNRREGKRIKVGSIQFLKSSQSHRFRSFKLTEIPLLLLRLLLLFLLILILTGPFWMNENASSELEPGGWVLISPELVNNLNDARMLQKVDSLVSAGYELRLLAANFPEVSIGDEVPYSESEVNYWSVLREANMKAQDNCTFWIFAPQRLISIRGERPALKAAVHWVTIENFTQNRWIEEAGIIQKDSVKIVLGISDSSKTYFKRFLCKLPAQREIVANKDMPPVEITPVKQSKEYTLRLIEQDAVLEDNTLKIGLDSEPLNVWILFDDSRRDDARYVFLALEAAAEFAHKNVMIKKQSIDGNQQKVADTDWIFWLSEKSVPGELLDKVEAGGMIISDAGSKQKRKIESRIIFDQEFTGENVALFYRVPSSGTGTALWQDGFGESLLEFHRVGLGFHAQFHSRFHPRWNELVLKAAFPEWMMHLLETKELKGITFSSKLSISDQRGLSTKQSLPVKRASNQQAKPETMATSLFFPLWIIAVLLFIFERWMSERRINN